MMIRKREESHFYFANEKRKEKMKKMDNNDNNKLEIHDEYSIHFGLLSLGETVLNF